MTVPLTHPALETTRSPAGGFRRAPATLRLAGVLLLLACASPPSAPDREPWLAVADFVDHQRLHLTTDLISVPEQIGLEHFEHGWRPNSDEGSRLQSFVIWESRGRLTVFSADGDLAALELELALTRSAETRKVDVVLELNGRSIGRLEVGHSWSRHRLKLPPKEVRAGNNLLALRPLTKHLQAAPGEPPRVQLRRLRLRSRSGRRLWAQRPSTVRVVAGDSGPSVCLEMPTASYLDVVFRAPSGGRLTGTYLFEPAADEERRAAYVYVQLLGEQSTEQTMFHRRLLRSVHSPRAVALDLEPWSGQLIRLRLGITGPGNGLVRWCQLRIQADGPPTALTSLPPIARLRPARSGRLGRPDVLVLLLDAARADAFSPFGGPHPTPGVERLAADGTIFEQALATAPWTVQSVSSLLTGLYPDTLSVGPWGSRLPDEVPTIAELMQRAGYRTVLWSQHPLYRNHSSFRRGFDDFQLAPRGRFGALPGAEDLLADSRSTFALVHLIPPHAPYEPPRPFLGSYSSWYGGDMSVDVKHLNRFPSRSDPRELSPEDLRYVRDRYLENAAFADHLVGNVLTSLDTRNRYDDALIILVSDHGEALLEHGGFLHGRHLYREDLHVPWIIKWPASASGFSTRITGPVSLVDLVPTLVDGLDLTAGEIGFQGVSLLPEIYSGQRSPRSLYAVTRGAPNRHRPPKTQVMLTVEGWRLLYNPITDRSQLFRVDRDPLETRDLAAELPLQTLLLRQSVLSQMRWNQRLLGHSADEGTLEPLDSATVEQLQALGYLD